MIGALCRKVDYKKKYALRTVVGILQLTSAGKVFNTTLGISGEFSTSLKCFIMSINGYNNIIIIGRVDKHADMYNV